MGRRSRGWVRWTVVLAAMLVADTVVAEVPAFTVTVEGSGRPMILIPGLSSPPSVWDGLADRLAADHELHRLGLAGFAGAAPIGGALLSEVRRQLAAYIRAQELDRPVVVGHSLGGFLALWLAATEPELVGPVVSVDGLPALAAVMNETASPEEIARQAEAMSRFLAGLGAEAFAEQTRASLATMISDEETRDRVAAAAVESDPATVGRAMAELLTTDLRPLLPQITVPVLLFAPTAGMPEAVAEQVAGRYRRQVAPIRHHRVVVVPAARHFVMLDAPELFLDTIDDFLAGAAAGRATGDEG